MTIGENIQFWRKKAGYTQKELANKCGVATGTIQQYELGKRQPRFEQLKNIAKVLGIYVGELLGEHYRDYEEHIISDAIPEIEKALLNATVIPDTIYYPSERITKMNDLFETLNETGQEKAIEHVEMLAKIPEYRKEED